MGLNGSAPDTFAASARMGVWTSATVQLNSCLIRRKLTLEADHHQLRAQGCMVVAPPALPGTGPCCRAVRFPDGLNVTEY
jgi:hypothetical protein